MYVLYTSNVNNDDTAISSALVDDVTAMKSSISIKIAPPWPRSVIAVAGDDRPAPFSATESGCGYVGKRGLLVRAAQPNPIAVAKPNGMPYHAIPP